jgi:hypothetical protein
MGKVLTIREIQELVDAGVVERIIDGDNTVYQVKVTAEILVPAEKIKLISEARARFESGEDDALETLSQLPNAGRGNFVAECFELLNQGRISTKEWRAHDYLHLARAAKSIDRLQKWFRAAEFRTSHLRTRMVVYRGGSGVDTEVLAYGISWTRQPEIAAWYAVDFFPRGEPLVVQRDVIRRSVYAHITSRQEDEIVLLRAGPSRVYGNIELWREMSKRHEAEKKKQEMERLAAIKAGW